MSATLRSVMLGLLCALLLATFVWPTPWREEIHPSGRYRINRFTGTRQMESGRGWKDLPDGEPTDSEIRGP